jgi:demethylmenaquinone methyltransferase/2-methoxy-6-polyprenyl-1,4-benzoquinol methylase
MGRNYDRAAWFYETAARIYSLNAIAASKRYQLRLIQPGERVIFLGAGSGEDAVAAAALGADVTCIDISSRMLDSVRRRLDGNGLQAHLVCCDALEYDQPNCYDACCANYFLNVFQLPAMLIMMEHATGLIRPGGKLMIADMALPRGNAAQRLANVCYRKFAMASFCLMGLVPWHNDYDYPIYFSRFGLTLEEIAYFRLFRGGPVVHQCIVGVKRTGVQI